MCKVPTAPKIQTRLLATNANAPSLQLDTGANIVKKSGVRVYNPTALTVVTATEQIIYVPAMKVGKEVPATSQFVE
jgi:hypothetical protein